MEKGKEEGYEGREEEETDRSSLTALSDKDKHTGVKSTEVRVLGREGEGTRKES